MTGAQRMIEDVKLRILGLHPIAQLFGLAAADEVLGVGNGASAGHDGHRLCAGGIYKLLEFSQVATVGACSLFFEVDMNERGALAAVGAISQGKTDD
jgi:hypothetical protein